MARIYADNSINWQYLYEVTHETDERVFVRELGPFHRFDKDRQFTGEIAGTCEVYQMGEHPRIRLAGQPWKRLEMPSAHCSHQIFTVEISKLTEAMLLGQIVWQDGIQES